MAEPAPAQRQVEQLGRRLEKLQSLPAGCPLRRGFHREEVNAVLAAKGRLDHWQMLRCRVRYFADGLTLGTKAFVNKVFAARREHFGPKRTTGVRPLRGLDARGLCALRDLRVRAVG